MPVRDRVVPDPRRTAGGGRASSAQKSGRAAAYASRARPGLLLTSWRRPVSVGQNLDRGLADEQGDGDLTPRWTLVNRQRARLVPRRWPHGTTRHDWLRMRVRSRRLLARDLDHKITPLPPEGRPGQRPLPSTWAVSFVFVADTVRAPLTSGRVRHQ